MITFAIIGSYGIVAPALVYLALMIPALYIAVKNEQFPFLLPWMLLVVLIPAIGAIVYIAVYVTRKKHKSRFETMPVEESEEKSTRHQDQKTFAGIPEDTVSHILICLDGFEKKEDYLNPSITLAGLAKDYNVSSRHLSKVVTFYKKKRFNTYINTLRIDYLVRELRSGSDLRKYTMRALTRETGFPDTTAFTIAFLRRTGMYPTLFIAELGYDEEEEWVF